MSDEYLASARHNIYERGMPRGIPTSLKRESRIIARLLVQRHALLVARKKAWASRRVWRLADRECIELMAGQEAKGYWRLSPAWRAAVIEARHMNPDGTQQEIARAAGVNRATVSRIERGGCRGGAAHAALVARRMVDMPTL
jgi:hypothetical protein